MDDNDLRALVRAIPPEQRLVFATRVYLQALAAAPHLPNPFHGEPDDEQDDEPSGDR